MIKSALIALFITWLPIENANTKMQIGIILSSLLEYRGLYEFILNRFKKSEKQQITIPDSTKDRDFNPLFDKVQEYLSNKFSKLIESCELVPKNGDVEFNLKDMTGKVFTDEYNGHTLQLYMHHKESDSHSKPTIREIAIKSNTASSEDVRNYVRKISSIQLKNTNSIKIFRAIIRGKKKEDRTVEWEQIVAKTNKTLENTIYSESFQKEMFDDLDQFMNSEKEYSKKGIPYKRGYFLHSTPGQGKTSVAKIVANKYGTPIFCLDLTTIEDNATLIKLMTELNYHTQDNKYILLIEDAERCDFFDHRYRDPRISMDCFLNVIDGVVEPHGRIIIMTANDPTLILENKALMRAGRIDKTIELLPCNKYQIRRMYELFFSGSTDGRPDNLETDNPNDSENALTKYTVNWDEWEFNETLSAAYIMKILQENANNPKVFMHMVGEAKTGDDKDVKLDDTFLNVITAAKEEQKNDGKNVKKDKFGRRISNRRNRNRPKSNKIEDVIQHTKYTIKNTTHKTEILAKRKARLETKLPILLDKLKVKKEKVEAKKLKEKAAKRIEYFRKKLLIEKFKEKTDDYVEEEYETPAFLLNSIEQETVPDGTITTYENLEIPEELSIDMLSKAAEFQPTVYDPVTKEQIPIAPVKVLSLRSTTPVKLDAKKKVNEANKSDSDEDEDNEDDNDELIHYENDNGEILD